MGRTSNRKKWGRGRQWVAGSAMATAALSIAVAVAGPAGAQDEDPTVGTIQPTGLEPVSPYVPEPVPTQPVGPTGNSGPVSPQPVLTQPPNPNPEVAGLPTQLPRDNGPTLLHGQVADLGDPNHVAPPDLGDPNVNGQDEPPDTGT